MMIGDVAKLSRTDDGGQKHPIWGSVIVVKARTVLSYCAKLLNCFKLLKELLEQFNNTGV